MEARDLIQTAFRLSLPATLVYDYPTLASLASFVHQRLAGGAARQPLAQQGPKPGLRREELRAALLPLVQELVGQSVDARAPLAAAGLDSLTALELRECIQRHGQLRAASVSERRLQPSASPCSAPGSTLTSLLRNDVQGAARLRAGHVCV